MLKAAEDPEFIDILASAIRQEVGELLDKLAPGWQVEVHGEYNWRVTSPNPPPARDGIPTRVLALFGMRTLPGCCGAVVVHNSWINAGLRKRGVGLAMCRARLLAAKAAGYGVAIATTVTPESARVLYRAGYVVQGKFTNPRTGNTVTTHTCSLMDWK
jgi:hypothetical protein